MALTLQLRRVRLAAAPLAIAGALVSLAAAQDTPANPAPPSSDTPGESSDSSPSDDEPTVFRPRTELEKQLTGVFGDHHIAIVGDQLITRDEVFGFIRSRDFDDPSSRLPADMPPEKVEEAKFLAALEQMIEAELKIQGGRNEGFEPEIVKQARDNAFDRQVAARGGSTQMSTWLEGWGLTPDEFRDYIERRLLSQFWEDSVTGRSPGGTGRQYVDPFIRPGQLFARYRTYARDPDPRFGEIVGRLPARLVLRQLVIDSSTEGGVEPARALAEAARDNIEKGIVDFDGVVNEYAAADAKGEGSYLRGPRQAILQTLKRLYPGEDLQAYVETAPIGELSQLLRYDSGDGATYFVVYRVEERLAATSATPFLDLGLQTRLRESMVEEEDAIRVARGLGELVRSTYVAPTEIRDALLQRGRRRQ